MEVDQKEQKGKKSSHSTKAIWGIFSAPSIFCNYLMDSVDPVIIADDDQSIHDAKSLEMVRLNGNSSTLSSEKGNHHNVGIKR